MQAWRGAGLRGAGRIRAVRERCTFCDSPPDGPRATQKRSVALAQSQIGAHSTAGARRGLEGRAQLGGGPHPIDLDADWFAVQVTVEVGLCLPLEQRHVVPTADKTPILGQYILAFRHRNHLAKIQVQHFQHTILGNAETRAAMHHVSGRGHLWPYPVPGRDVDAVHFCLAILFGVNVKVHGRHLDGLHADRVAHPDRFALASNPEACHSRGLSSPLDTCLDTWQLCIGAVYRCCVVYRCCLLCVCVCVFTWLDAEPLGLGALAIRSQLAAKGRLSRAELVLLYTNIIEIHVHRFDVLKIFQSSEGRTSVERQ